jgi:hypothetical protein
VRERERECQSKMCHSKLINSPAANIAHTVAAVENDENGSSNKTE